MASRSDRSSNHFSPAMRTNFPRRSGNKDSPSSFHTKLPSRWIKVRSPQVEGGDVGARLRTRDSSVSKSIPGGQTTLWGGGENSSVGPSSVGLPSQLKSQCLIPTETSHTSAEPDFLQLQRLQRSAHTELLTSSSGVINRICSTAHSPAQLLGYK